MKNMKFSPRIICYYIFYLLLLQLLVFSQNNNDNSKSATFRNIMDNPYIGWEGHYGKISDISFKNTDDTLVSIGDEDASIRFFDVRNGALINVLGGSASPINSFSISPDGSKLVSGCNKKLFIWNLTSGLLLKILDGGFYSTNSIVFSSDGNKCAFADVSKSFSIYDFRLGQVVKSFTGLTLDESAIAFSPDGTKIASGNSTTVKIWDIDSGTEIKSFKNFSSIIDKLYYLNDEKIVVQDFLTLNIFNPISGMILKTIPNTYKVSLSPDGKKIATLTNSSDTLIKIWDLNTMAMVWTYTKKDLNLSCLKYSPSGEYLAVGEYNGKIDIIDIKNNTIIKSFWGNSSNINSIRISADGNRLYTSSYNSIKKWDSENKTQLLSIENNNNNVKTVAISPDEKIIASGDDFMNIIFWDSNTGNSIDTLRGHKASVRSLVFSPDGSKLISGGYYYDTSVFIWDVKKRKLLRELPAKSSPTYGLDFSPDGSKIVSSNGITMNIWEYNTSNLLSSVIDLNGLLYCATFSPDGKRIAYGGADKTVSIWDVEKGINIFKLIGHSGNILSIKFSPDREKLASASDDGTIKIWNPNSGALLRDIYYEYGYANSICFTPESKKLITGGSGYDNIRIYDLSYLTSTKANNNPETFSLSQNYPNPFNPSTIISYQLPVNSFVTLKVYDILGREVARLVNEKKQPGSYQVKFDGRRLTSGIYFYHFQTDKYSEMKKMMFIK